MLGLPASVARRVCPGGEQQGAGDGESAQMTVDVGSHERDGRYRRRTEHEQYWRSGVDHAELVEERCDVGVEDGVRQDDGQDDEEDWCHARNAYRVRDPGPTLAMFTGEVRGRQLEPPEYGDSDDAHRQEGDPPAERLAKQRSSWYAEREGERCPGHGDRDRLAVQGVGHHAPRVTCHHRPDQPTAHSRDEPADHRQQVLI
jgi:hypothetical protein